MRRDGSRHDTRPLTLISGEPRVRESERAVQAAI